MKIFFLSLVVKLDFNVESLLALARAWCTHFRDFAQLNTHTRTHTHTHTHAHIYTHTHTHTHTHIHRGGF